jgi:hypothetical protein
MMRRRFFGDMLKAAIESARPPEQGDSPAPREADKNIKEAKMAEKRERDYVELLVPDGMRLDMFYDELYERLMPKYGITGQEGKSDALEKVQALAKEIAYEGKANAYESNMPFEHDIAKLLVNCSDKNLQMQNGQVIHPAVYKGELKEESPEETEAVERKPEQAAQVAAVDNLANFAGGFAMAAGAHLPHGAGGLAPQNQRQAQRDISHNTPAPRQAEKTKNKEAGMANEEARGNTPEERAFWAAVHQRKVVADALKAGTLSCLPGKDGVADTEPAVNIANGTRYHGANLLFLKEHQKQNGFPTAEYVTQNAVQESGIPIRAGQHGVDIKISEKNEQSGEWENKTVRLFNVAQCAKPWEMKQWAADKLDAEAREKQEFLKKQFGDNFVPQQKREAQKGADVVCSSTEPEKYLGQYLAAVSMGSKFKATAEQAAEFSKNFEGALFAKNANGHSNPFELSKLCGKANEVCKETVKQIHAQELAPRQQELAQKRGRGM